MEKVAFDENLKAEREWCLGEGFLGQGDRICKRLGDNILNDVEVLASANMDTSHQSTRKSHGSSFETQPANLTISSPFLVQVSIIIISMV
jgi:hypothetical protein